MKVLTRKQQDNIIKQLIAIRRITRKAFANMDFPEFIMNLDATVDAISTIADIVAGIRGMDEILDSVIEDHVADMKKPECDEFILCTLDKGAYTPVKAHEDDAGFDMFTRSDIMLQPGEAVTVDTGVHVAIPKHYVGTVASKSGLDRYHHIKCDGRIDTGYTGSVCVTLYNFGKEPYEFKAGDKIAQLIVERIHEDSKMFIVESLEESERGEGGFGSTGR